ncbi:MAG: YdeI/OmpD-associated family protein, partial [Candidatus Eremiobacteraeota bacterium]|nr:YdeI/OmpD-associated family protein [Candidatus Eremiobacteraeota bacterium]
DLTRLGRLDWMRWINSAKTPETRARRVRRTVEQLSSGKRRPCCVNFYEFMLHRVGEQ